MSYKNSLATTCLRQRHSMHRNKMTKFIDDINKMTKFIDDIYPIF